MGTIKDFEDLEIWKMARELVNLIPIFSVATPKKRGL